MSAILWPLRNEDLARGAVFTTYALRVSIDGIVEDLECPTIGTGVDVWMAGDDQAAAGEYDVGRRFLERTFAGHSVVIGGAVVTVSVSATNRISIESDADLSIEWAHANTTLSALPFGWAQANTVASQFFTAPNQTRGAWCPRLPSGEAMLPTEDSRSIRQIEVAGAVALSGLSRVSRLGEARAPRNLAYDLVLPRFALSEYADATEPTGTAEDLWRFGLTYGRRVRYYANPATRTANSYSVLMFRAEEPMKKRDDVVFRSRARLRWAVRLPLREA